MIIKEVWIALSNIRNGILLGYLFFLKRVCRNSWIHNSAAVCFFDIIECLCLRKLGHMAPNLWTTPKFSEALLTFLLGPRRKKKTTENVFGHLPQLHNLSTVNLHQRTRTLDNDTSSLSFMVCLGFRVHFTKYYSIVKDSSANLGVNFKIV